MIAIPFGASGIFTVQRWIRKRPPSSHSKLSRPLPGQGGPPGGLASIVHSPSSGSSSASIASSRRYTEGEQPHEAPDGRGAALDGELPAPPGLGRLFFFFFFFLVGCRGVWAGV